MTSRGTSDLDLIRDAMEIAYSPVQRGRSEVLKTPSPTKSTRKVALSSSSAIEYNRARPTDFVDYINHGQELNRNNSSDDHLYGADSSPQEVMDPYRYAIENRHFIRPGNAEDDARQPLDGIIVRFGLSTSLIQMVEADPACATTTSYKDVHSSDPRTNGSRDKDHLSDQRPLQNDGVSGEDSERSQVNNCRYFGFRGTPQQATPRVSGESQSFVRENASRLSSSLNGSTHTQRFHPESESTKLLKQHQLFQSYLGRNGTLSPAEQMARGEDLQRNISNEAQFGSEIISDWTSFTATCVRRPSLDSCPNGRYGSRGSQEQESIAMEISPEDESQNIFTDRRRSDLKPCTGHTPGDERCVKMTCLHSHPNYKCESQDLRNTTDMATAIRERFLRTGDTICCSTQPTPIGYPSTILPPQSKNFLSPCGQDRSLNSDHHNRLFGQQDSEAREYRIGDNSEMDGSSSVFPNHYPVSSFEELVFGNKSSAHIRLPFTLYDNNSEPDTYNDHTSQHSSSPLPTPSHITPTHHSPLKWVDSPSRPKMMIHQSVEKDPSSHSYVRESTPAYEDRSPSPSPISRTDKTNAELALDTEMLEAPCETSHHTTRDQLCPATPDLSRGRPQRDIMRPPPSPSRSQTASPNADIRSFREASPSTLRSSAIARVLNQSHSPHRHTRYPSSNRSLSPEARPHHQYYPSQLNLSSISQPQFSPPLPHDRHRVSPNSVIDKVKKGFPAPPPIPDSPPSLKPMKRGGRRKSIGASSGAKVMKNRTVTTGAGISGVTDGKGKGKRSVTVTKRQRAVTAALASEGQWQKGDQGVCDGPAVNDIMDVDVDVDGGVDVSTTRADPAVGMVDPNATPSPLRRSTRLRRPRS